MLTFKDISLSDKESIEKAIGSNPTRLCENTCGLILAWDREEGRNICFQDGVMYIYGEKKGRYEFDFPVGGDEKALEKIVEFCRENGKNLTLSYLDENQKNTVEKFFSTKCESDRDWADYIYLSEDLKTLAGKKYHGQKNHVNRFLKEYPDHAFLPYEKGQKPEIMRFAEKFYAEKQSSHPLFSEDKKLFFRILDEADDICPLGGILKAGDEVVAVSFGEKVGDTLYIHYEKALRAYSGSYAAINYLFANRYADVKYVNREEDCGDYGLRISKTALHPCFLAEKYFVDIDIV